MISCDTFVTCALVVAPRLDYISVPSDSDISISVEIRSDWSFLFPRGVQRNFLRIQTSSFGALLFGMLIQLSLLDPLKYL